MKNYLSLIKFSHTIFALPFAMIGFFLGYEVSGLAFQPLLLFYVVLCMVFARSAAMAFNRWLDRDIDASNPRTVVREIPSGLVSEKAAFWFVIANATLFVITTYFINTICFLLSPVALLVILGYSYTKRFTAFCHLVLGLGLALAPVGAYLAVTGYFDIIPVLIGGSVLFWVAGFDVIYALQDEGFDRSKELHSIPVVFGTKNSMNLSSLMHFISICLIVSAVILSSQSFESIGLLGFIGLGLFISLLIYQHLIIKPNDLSRINLAFFTTNGVASLIFGSLFIIDLLI